MSELGVGGITAGAEPAGWRATQSSREEVSVAARTPAASRVAGRFPGQEVISSAAGAVCASVAFAAASVGSQALVCGPAVPATIALDRPRATGDTGGAASVVGGGGGGSGGGGGAGGPGWCVNG